MQQAFKFGMSLFEYESSTPRELHNFIKAVAEQKKEDIEREIDNVKHIMWASISAMAGSKEADKVIPLKGREQAKPKELTGFQKQELSEWSKQMDAEMGLK